uniref:Adaptor protein ClpS core domain-containing protein n=1 Tax=Phaeomonas parva TaxID=124430 RepID=A0A7S1TU33_9STRA|mmetsp:Transcript_17889/g.54758  ORF Transcript_17889/g.54758 Transcript_17889/m.54758 type:complete len:151 (+) Transcript_17889:143-595(+)
MRVVFVAALLALCLGGADAFAPMAPRRTLAKRASALNMAKIGRSGPEIEGSSKVLVKTIDKVDEKVEEKQKEDLDKEQWWRVLLHNDEIHTFEYVIEEIVGTVPTVTRRKVTLRLGLSLSYEPKSYHSPNPTPNPNPNPTVTPTPHQPQS